MKSMYAACLTRGGWRSQFGSAVDIRRNELTAPNCPGVSISHWLRGNPAEILFGCLVPLLYAVPSLVPGATLTFFDFEAPDWLVPDGRFAYNCAQ